MLDIRRRQFITLIGGAAAWPLAARAQQGERMRLIGVLMTGRINAQLRIDTIQQGLQKLGWADGRNVHIEYRWAVGDAEKARVSAKELVDEQPDVLLALGSIAVRALLRETRTVPIVFMHVADPVGQGFVRSLAHPGGNATGFTNFEEAMGGKWLGLLKEIAPNTTRLALLANPETAPYPFYRSVEMAAAQLGVRVVSAPIHNTSELEDTINAHGVEPGSALLVLPDFFTSTHRDLIVKLAAQNRVPAIYSFRFFTTIGGLISYGVDPEEPFGQAPAYINRILEANDPPISRFRGRPNSTCRLILRPPRRSASTCRRCSSRPPTR